jgi:hypothetical protein
VKSVLMRGLHGKILVILAVAFYALVSPSPVGFADTNETTDADDTPSPFDIKVATHGHRRLENGQRLIAHQMEMWEPWDSDLLKEAEVSQIVFSYDTNGRNTSSDPANRDLCGFGFERILDIRIEEDGSLYAEMRNKKGRLAGYAKVWRPDDRSVRVEFKKRLLKRSLTRYRWCASTSFSDEDRSLDQCGRSEDQSTICHDRVPEDRTVSHRI